MIIKIDNELIPNSIVTLDFTHERNLVVTYIAPPYTDSEDKYIEIPGKAKDDILEVFIRKSRIFLNEIHKCLLEKGYFDFDNKDLLTKMYEYIE